MGELTTARIGQVSAPQLPPRVRSLLAADELDDDRRSAGLAPLARVEDKAEVRAALEAIERALLPAAKAQTVLMLTRLAAHFPMQGRGEGQWRTIFEDYADDLEDMPADIVEQGCSTYRRQGKWWPKSAELMEIMIPLLQGRRRQRKRLQRLASGDEQRRTERPIDLEERKRVGQKLGDLARQIASWSDPGGGTAA